MITAIINARVFDGETVLDENTVVIEDQTVLSVGGEVPAEADIIDAKGATLLPGLIDSHVHTKIPQLQLALKFGVTTELEMMGHWTPEQRKEVTERDDIADLRTADFGMTVPGGHPSELHGPRRGGGGPPPGQGSPKSGPPGQGTPGQGAAGHGHRHDIKAPFANSPEEAIKFVAARVASGADYIKIMIEEGTVLKAPGLPMMSDETVKTAVKEAHNHGKLAIAHVLTYAATKEAIEAGMDGLAHIFIDKPHDSELVNLIATSGAFVTPCLVLNSSIMGNTGSILAADERVSSKLSPEWHATLCSSFNTFPQGNFNDVLSTVSALHKAGVDILVGTDASVPQPHLGGLAHGASVHHEMQMLVEAGFTPLEALKAATAVPARRFGLNDRGQIAVGKRADLLLVDGDPTVKIGDSLSIREVWRRGLRLSS